MDSNFTAVVDVKDKDLRNYFEALANSQTKDFVMGSFDPKTSTINFSKQGSFKLKRQVNRNKHSLLFIRKRGEEQFRSVETEIQEGYIVKSNTDELLGEERQTDRRKTKILYKEINLNKLPKSKLILKEGSERMKAMKMDPDEIKERLFEMFTEREKMYFDEIANELDQPRGYLQNILEEIANKKKEGNRFVYSLRDTYLFKKDNGQIKKLKKT